MSLLLSLFALVGRLGVLLGVLRSATEFTNVEYPSSGDGGTTLHAYLATPPDYDASKEYPTAIVLHAWNGMSNEPVYFADLLAAEGYVALAPDLFRGVAAESLLIPWNILSVVLAPQDRMDADVDDAIAWLASTTSSSEDEVVSGPGFCFGGSQALELARRRPVRATVSLYGSSVSELNADTSDEDWGLLGSSSPVLAIFGEEDGAPTPEAATAFAEALEARGVEHFNVTVYPGVGHAFVNPEDHALGNQQAVDAWDQTTTFLSEVAAGVYDADTAAAADRKRTRREVAERRPRPYRHGLSWIEDHVTDYLYGKGHGAPRSTGRSRDDSR